ncbi:MAG: alpha/beta fold hydrolase [Candidatus Nanopelagicales bacterium]
MSTSQIADETSGDLEFPSLQARTGRFRYGMPQSFVGSKDGRRIAFIRSRSGTDSRGCIWVANLDESGEVVERVIVDVAHPGGAAVDDVPEAEKARRERLRESGSGVTAFSANAELTLFCFAFGGSLFVAETLAGTNEFAIRMLEVPGPVVDPRLSPDGRQVAWVAGDSLYVAPIVGGGSRLVAQADGPDQTVGLANFLAAEEFNRFRGFWWSPDSSQLLVEEVDSSNVELWEIPTGSSEGEGRKVRYPAAGTTNPKVTLAIYDVASGTADNERPGRTQVNFLTDMWHHSPLEYLVTVSWTLDSGPVITLFDRDQQFCIPRTINPLTGEAGPVPYQDDERWFELIAGTPLALGDDKFVHTGIGEAVGTITIDDEDTYSEVDLGDYMLRAVYGKVNVDGAQALLLGVHQDSSENHLAIAPIPQAGSQPCELQLLTSGEAWYSASIVATNRLVVSRSTIDSFVTEFTWMELGANGLTPLGTISTAAVAPELTLNLERHLVGPNELNTTVQWPMGHVPGSSRLPVIMNPYGGPHAQRVVQSGRAFAETQWLADQGFCVIVSDVRGATGRSVEDQHSFYRDLTDGPLSDQVTVIEWAAAKWPDDIDSDRVGIMGWSFGGYLAALAVLRRPDVFAAAIAGAPVTDWRLYDTAYTERYLGHPEQEPEVYEKASLIPLAPDLERPLLIIHGLSDDNVFFEHSRLLSEALTQADKPHTLLPLEDVTHMASNTDIATNLLIQQRDFFYNNL